MEHLSPSGRYKLLVSSEPTKPGCWDYTIGRVFSKDSDVPLFKVRRNYSSFPFLFVEDHPNGHDYLVCGADYQGQTVLELDTGTRKDFLPEDAKQGFGFCWADYTFDRERKLLTVDGCIWAAPYEYRFYDFSDPMSLGWPQVEFENDGYAFAEGKEPTWNEDGTVTLWETRTDDDYTSEEDPKPYAVASKTYRREGLVFRLVSEWVEDKEKVLREEAAVARKKWEEEWEKFKATDPLILLVKEKILPYGFDDSKSYVWSVGQAYEGWCPHFTGKDGTVNRRLFEKREVKGLLGLVSREVTVDLSWGREQAPIKIQVYINGKGPETTWYPHSIEGMTEALDFARRQIA